MCRLDADFYRLYQTHFMCRLNEKHKTHTSDFRYNPTDLNRIYLYTELGDTRRADVFCLYQPMDLQLSAGLHSQNTGMNFTRADRFPGTQGVKWRGAKDSDDATEEIPGVSADGTTQVT